MPGDAWTILHGGALGDLALTIQLALRLPVIGEAETLRLIARVDPGDLSACRPSIMRRSSEGLGLHWLHGDHDAPAPATLREVIAGARILSTLGGPHTITYQRLKDLRPAALYGLDPRPREGVQRHITDQWQTQLEDQGLLVPKCIHQRPQQRGLGVPNTLRERGQTLLRLTTITGRGSIASSAAREPRAAQPPKIQEPKSRIVVMHPGSGGRAKCWPLSNFVALARELREREISDVCFLLGPAEIERWPAEDIEHLGQDFPLIISPTPNELIALLAAADVYVGNDAGPTHLAALLRTPTVAIFGPTSPTVWRPLGPRAAVLAGRAAGASEDWGIRAADIIPALRAATG